MLTLISGGFKKDSSGHRKTTYGYKIHSNSDEDGFIKKLLTTTGSMHNSNCFEELLTGEESAVYADSACKSAKHDKILEDRNIRNEIHDRCLPQQAVDERTKEEKHQQKPNAQYR